MCSLFQPVASLQTHAHFPLYDVRPSFFVASLQLGLTEIDAFMLQRKVKVAEEESRKWRQRFLMVEKDIRRAEKLLKDFTKSKTNELEAQGGLLASTGGGGGSGPRWESLPSPAGGGRVSVSGGGRRLEEGSWGGESSSERAKKKKVGRRRRDKKKEISASPSLSQLARGFNSVDELMGGSPSSTFMKAVFSGDSDLTSAKGRNKTPLELSPLGLQVKEKRRGRFGGLTTEIAEGMAIDAHDTYHDIAVKNNRRGTAKARSYAGAADLWPPLAT